MKLNTLLPVALALIAGLVAGLLLSPGEAPHDAAAPADSGGDASEPEVAYWVAPMDPAFRSDKPGKSPMGMDLVPVYEDETSDATVRISSTMANNIGIRTARIERSDLARKARTVGFVGYDEMKVSHIHMRAEGWIDELTVKSEGERVKKGDLIFRIYSPDLVVAQSEYVQALKQGQTVLSRLAKERLGLLNFLDSQITELKRTGEVRQLVDVYADQDGIVVDLNIAENMFVTPGTTILTIVDLSSVWVLADVFEEEAQWMKVGLPASVNTPFQPDAVRRGTVDYVYPTIDPVTRTLKVRLKFDNPDELLKPNMYAEVSISGEPKARVLSIPRDALIRTGTSQRVILALDGGAFEPREVKTGMVSNDRIEIVSGLKDGDILVVSGQFLIDSEASLSASFRRMGEAPTMDDADGAMVMPGPAIDEGD